MQNVKDVYLLVGSNIEPRELFLREAKKEIDSLGPIVEESPVYESEAWGFEADTPFLNQVLLIQTILKAKELLRIILKIEQSLGRIRSDNHYSSRTIDIDVLYFGNDIIKQEDLVVPHPRIQDRKFTLMPLNEIAADFIHPVLRMTNKELLERTDDKGKVWRYKNK
jgi:2-amino-4-hydroxy-6-hydroxymethyldihydropteridine diphosphokinase